MSAAKNIKNYTIQTTITVEKIQYTCNLDFVKNLQLQIESNGQTYYSSQATQQNGGAVFNAQKVQLQNFSIQYDENSAKFGQNLCNLVVKLNTENDVKYGGVVCVDLSRYLRLANECSEFQKKFEKIQIQNCADKGAYIQLKISSQFVNNVKQTSPQSSGLSTDCSFNEELSTCESEAMNQMKSENEVLRDQILLLQKEKLFYYLREKELQKSFQEKLNKKDQEIKNLNKQVQSLYKKCQQGQDSILKGEEELMIQKNLVQELNQKIISIQSIQENEKIVFQGKILELEGVVNEKSDKLEKIQQQNMEEQQKLTENLESVQKDCVKIQASLQKQLENISKEYINSHLEESEVDKYSEQNWQNFFLKVYAFSNEQQQAVQSA